MPVAIHPVEPPFDATAVRIYPLGSRRWTVCRVTAGRRVEFDSDHRLRRDAMRRIRELLADRTTVEAVLIDRRACGEATGYRRAGNR